MELIILLAITIYTLSYRYNNGSSVYKFMMGKLMSGYDAVSPYSFKTIREKTKELGQEYTIRQYTTQVILFATGAAGIAYLYFVSITWALFYAVVAVAFIPYLAYLRCKRIYSEYIFEQIQIYTTNVIMEFNTTQSFVKSLEGVRDSGVLEEPVLGDLKAMIQMSYDNGTIDDALIYFNEKYPFYMVKNMHQLFLQINKEGAKDSGEALENMAMDIDSLVESVYRDRIDRAAFHKKFVMFGMILFVLVMILQLLFGREKYIMLIDLWYVKIILHGIILVNGYFLLNGEKYYNENVGAE